MGVIDKQAPVHYSACMPVFEFNQDNMPTGEEFRRILQQAEEDYDPLEELLSMERELARLEQDHGMASAEFFERYQTGELGDEFAYVVWAGTYRLYLRLRKAISESLNLVLAAEVLSLR